ncbi:MAG TPA: YcaO-like family protein [Terracidiphilus sp.]|nr:YcaO-like family protein [Terracidiphilus sp.]
MYGTIRERTARETLSQIEPLARSLGVTRVGNLTGLDRVGVPVWMAVRPLAKSLTVAQGKGLTDELSRCSALMESIETYHAEQAMPDAIEWPLSAYQTNAEFIDPNRVPLRAPLRGDDDPLICWVEGRDQVRDATRWIPHELFALDSTRRRSRPPVFAASSNGLASGNTRREAILHGICEVIERDQTSRWMRDHAGVSSSSSKVVLDTVNDPDCREIVDRCRRAGLDLHVWSASVDIEIPVFWAVVADFRDNACFPHRAVGSGCHPIKEIALSRAMTEALQVRISNISGLRDDVGWVRYRDDAIRCPGSWIAEIRGQKESVDFGSIQSLPCPERIPDLMASVRQSLESAGIREIIVVDLTRNEIGVPVVFVCIPDLGLFLHQDHGRQRGIERSLRIGV